MFNRVIILLFILIGCTAKNEDSKDSEVVKINFKSQKLKTIPVDGLDVSLSYAIQYPNSSLVYFTNYDTENKLAIYKLNLNTLKINTLLEVVPDYSLEAYSIDAKQSKIYLFTGEELIVYNFNNRLLNRKPFGTLKKGYLSNLNPVGFYPYIKNDILYIEYFPNIKETFKSKLFYRQPFQAALNLKNKKLRLLDMTYPKEYQRKCFGYNFIPDRIIGVNNTHIVSFPYNDSVYVYNDHGQLQETIYFGTAKRKQFQFIPYDELKNLQHEVFDEYNKDTPHYGFSTFFSFSKLYSRQLIWYNEKSDKYSGTIIFYDTKWHYLGELNTTGTMSLFDSQKFGLVKIELNNDNLEIYEVSLK